MSIKFEMDAGYTLKHDVRTMKEHKNLKIEVGKDSDSKMCIKFEMGKILKRIIDIANKKIQKFEKGVEESSDPKMGIKFQSRCHIIN